MMGRRLLGCAAAQLLTVIERLDPRDRGRFMAWDGSEIPL
jgi:hypothetical protein